jgi:tetratricopeptide (TPR) repeat protein
MRRKLAVIAVAVVAVAAVGAVLGWRWLRADPVPQFDLTEAEPAVQSVIESARERVVKEPRSGRAWGHLGQALLANGYDDEAMSVFEQAGRLDPSEPRWPYLRARRLMTLDRTEGLELLEQAVRLAGRADPDNVACKLLLVEALSERGEHERATGLAEEVLAKEPDNPRAHFYLGTIGLQRDDPKASLPHLLRASESPMLRKRACEKLAAVSLRLGDALAAERFARQSREPPNDLPPIDPYVAEYQMLTVGRQAKLLEADRLEAQKRMQESARVLQQLAESSPDARSENALGVALAKLGDNVGAEKVLLQALRKDPDSPAAHYALAVARFRQAEALREEGQTGAAAAKYAEAEQSALRALANKPDHANAHLFLGQARHRLGRRDEAIDSFRRAIACRPELAGPHLALGEALAEAKQREEARRELRLAIDLAPPGDPQGDQARKELERLDGN